MNNKLKVIFALTLLASSISQASYKIYMPLEQAKSGHLANNSIVFTKNTGVTPPVTNPDPVTPTEPTVPTEPEPTPEPTRKLVAQYSFYQDTVKWTGYYSADKLSKMYDYPESIIIDKILENGKKYYVSNAAYDCVFTAMVCTMNVPNASGGCGITDKNLSGQKTVLKNKVGPGGNKVCYSSKTEQIDGKYTTVWPNMQIHDLPK